MRCDVFALVYHTITATAMMQSCCLAVFLASKGTFSNKVHLTHISQSAWNARLAALVFPLSQD